MKSKEKAGAIIVAAGGSRRMNGIDKIFAPLGDKPVLARSVEVFEKCKQIDQIVIVVGLQNIEAGKKIVSEQGWKKVKDVCAGGDRRQDSVQAGLSHLKPCDWVLIHDGARPLVAEDLILRGLEEAAETGAAIAAVPVTDTIKMADKSNIVMGTPPRDNLWAVQTPQVFRFGLIMDAYRNMKGNVTDDSMLVERAGTKVKLYMGSYDNIKITTPNDMTLAALILEQRNK
jgi:2-C-methyl-D-erythritol 4-phosphate cytidylyltransferase